MEAWVEGDERFLLTGRGRLMEAGVFPGNLGQPLFLRTIHTHSTLPLHRLE
jgi:hypothetical protein